ncbi:hypothetical protein PYCC9005_003336 [Savitreella phatthalungensis]
MSEQRKDGVDGISCHILDTCLGRPASGVACVLRCQQQQRLAGTVNGSHEISRATTNADGRCVFNLHENDGAAKDRGDVLYTIDFYTAEYLRGIGTTSSEAGAQVKTGRAFWPLISVTFDPSAADRKTDGTLKFHIPLLLGPYSYSTYRGS